MSCPLENHLSQKKSERKYISLNDSDKTPQTKIEKSHLCIFFRFRPALYSPITISIMGCITQHKKGEDKITPEDIKLIWSKCLRTQEIVLTGNKRKQHPVFAQIAKDIDRTFPSHQFLTIPKNKKTFEKVLKAFALEFPKVGYTQGLNFVAGYLLIAGFNQQESLKTLVAMCIHPELMLIGLYEDDFPLCKLYCSIFWSLMKKMCPAAYKEIKEANIPDQLWIFQWFLTSFIYSFPLSYIQKFLNYIVVKHFFASVRIAIAIVQCLQKYISGIGKRDDGFIECFQLMKTEQFCKTFLPIEEVIKKAEKIKKDAIVNALKESQVNNWYKGYFSGSQSQTTRKYQKLMMDLKEQRDTFNADDPLSLRYTRLSSSMNIIDEIESSMAKLYEKTVYRSSCERNSVFSSKLSMKHYNSMGILEVRISQ